jgi:hypothetical protein
MRGGTDRIDVSERNPSLLVAPGGIVAMAARIGRQDRTSRPFSQYVIQSFNRASPSYVR